MLYEFKYYALAILFWCTHDFCIHYWWNYEWQSTLILCFLKVGWLSFTVVITHWDITSYETLKWCNRAGGTSIGETCCGSLHHHSLTHPFHTIAMTAAKWYLHVPTFNASMTFDHYVWFWNLLTPNTINTL